ncbi:MAG TPA: MFS transporter [Candidatus Binataceae bacterium]|nr:MFS transporter [Candidatus Binataceae bacterium]
MTRQERKGWLIIATLFTAIFFVMGATTNCISVFLTPLMKHFGWTHAKVSVVPTVFSLSLGLVSPLIGYLLDRLEARVVVCAGAVAAVAGLLIASQSTAIGSMAWAYIATGIGVGAATFIPASLVAANWFKDQRGLAVGVVVCGSSTSGILMPPLADYLVRSFGISATFLLLAIPIAVLVIPAVLLIVRTRPEGDANATSVAEQVKSLPGLDVGPALATRAFWLLALVQGLGMAGLGGTFYHLVPAMIDAGYSPAHGALVVSLQAAISVGGFVLMGWLADRFSARRVLPCALAVLGVSVLMLLGVRSAHAWGWWLAGYIMAFGLTAGCTSSLTPVVAVETLGLRRFGTLWGLIGLGSTIGLAGGPLLVGAVFDATSSYAMAFELCAAMLLTAAIAVVMISPAEGVEAVPASALRAVGH